MLILLFIFALIRHMHGAPTCTLSTLGADSSDLFARDDPIGNHLGTRQLSDVVVSCLATIFACTWTAIHPNIPGPCDSGWEIFKRQVTTMIYAILAPEAITGWALRQNIAARTIARKYNRVVGKKYSLVERSKHGWFQRKVLPPALGRGEGVAWTMTHGFLLQMGGFMLRKDGQPTQTLTDYEPGGASITRRIRRGDFYPPSITEAEIQDRSKGDGLTKAFVVLQTTWFVTQCIVRWSSSLPVTELEVVTLGFAMLNGITYGLWWNKPQSVGFPVYLEMNDSRGAGATKQTKGAVEESERGEAQLSRPAEYRTRAAPEEEGHDVVEEQVTERGDYMAENSGRTGERKNQLADGPNEVPIAHPAKRSYLSTKLEKDRQTGWQLIWRIPYRLVQAALRPLARMLDFSWTYVFPGDLCVPMFYSGEVETKFLYIVSSVIASMFGLIHLIPAWFLHFPSHPEMLLWRISAGIITAQPIVLGIWSWKEDGAIWSRESQSSAVAILALLGLPLYIIARLALIILALLSLQKLDNRALDTIDWISFIPHI